MGRVVVLHRLAVALFPAVDQMRVDVRAPVGAAFQQGHAQVREAARHAAEEQRLGEGLRAVGEVADVIEHVVAGGLPAGPALAAVVRGDGHAQLDHLGPERVVVVFAVDAVEVDIAGVAGDLRVLIGRILAGDGLDGPLHAAGDVDHLQAQRLDRELQFLDAFLRRVQGMPATGVRRSAYLRYWSAWKWLMARCSGWRASSPAPSGASTSFGNRME